MLSNSLNYTIKLSNIFNIKDITRSKVCPLMSLARDYNPFRYLLFLKQDKYFIDLYYTDTKDFADTEIFEIKFRLSQIYKQISKNEYINDFSKELKKLKIYRKCMACKALYNCPAIFIEEGGDAFGKSEQIIRNILKDIRGDIFDIGCGSINLYYDILKNLGTKKLIRYTGIDIDKKSIDSMRHIYSRDLPFIFIHTSIEKYKKERLFDYIIILRSINHIENSIDLVRKISSLLKKGGRILIADNIPFGLLRERKLIPMPDKDRDVNNNFQHYHNYNSYEVLDIFLRIRKFKILKHIAVSPTTANQWIIFLEKI